MAISTVVSTNKSGNHDLSGDTFRKRFHSWHIILHHAIWGLRCRLPGTHGLSRSPTTPRKACWDPRLHIGENAIIVVHQNEGSTACFISFKILHCYIMPVQWR